MYSIGDYVVKVNDGVCHVEEITQLNMSGVSNDKLYYLLVPINNKGSKIFVPVDGKAEELRFVVKPEEVTRIMESFPAMDMEWIANNKLRELKYKEVLHSGDLESMLASIKVMYQKRRERERTGKRNTAVDERYLKIMEDVVYTEFAFSIGCEKVEIREKILHLLGDQLDI